VQPQRLEHAALQEAPVAQPGRERRVAAAGEQPVRGVGEQVGRAVRSRLEVEGDLPAHRVAVDAQLLAVPQDGGEHVAGQFLLRRPPAACPASSSSRRASAGAKKRSSNSRIAAATSAASSAGSRVECTAVAPALKACASRSRASTSARRAAGRSRRPAR
jgi:hypothetical protein